MILNALSGWGAGRLDVALPDGSSLQYGPAASDRSVRVTVHEWRFFWRALVAGEIGVGESYMEGEWECSDLELLTRMFIEAPAGLDQRTPVRWGNTLLHGLTRVMRANTLRGSRRNIHAHYDLSNELFQIFLDDSMTYSSAVFPSESSTLDEGQLEKLDGICRKLDLDEGDHILEIGSGWGSFAMHAASQYGCRVTTLTLSEEQQTLARQRIREAGLENRIDVQLRDYRAMTGQFDHIVSIEMFEAVGFRYYGAFFGACERLLKPHGRMFLQSITIPDQRFDTYRRDFDWTRKYIFPGSLLASIQGIADALKRRTTLRIDSMTDIGPDYARTLRMWRERFLGRVEEVRRLGFDDRFIRMWEFYLATCEASFAARYIGNVQMILTRPIPYAVAAEQR
jgi:cyclopropane-fatty-acyl-phospholipid synthase